MAPSAAQDQTTRFEEERIRRLDHETQVIDHVVFRLQEQIIVQHEVHKRSLSGLAVAVPDSYVDVQDSIAASVDHLRALMTTLLKMPTRHERSPSPKHPSSTKMVVFTDSDAAPAGWSTQNKASNLRELDPNIYMNKLTTVSSLKRSAASSASAIVSEEDKEDSIPTSCQFSAVDQTVTCGAIGAYGESCAWRGHGEASGPRAPAS